VNRYAITDTAFTLSGASLYVVATLVLLFIFGAPLLAVSLPGVLALWMVIVFGVWHSRTHHPHKHFGSANVVTTFRAATTVIIAAFIPSAEQLSPGIGMWAIAIAATVTLSMDGLDGYLARKTGLSSDFGARFDMETDALLGLVITLLLWQSTKVGVWVLGLGLMRYAFMLAAIGLPALRAELYPSMRRKVVCVVQVGSLCLMLCPWLSSTHATLLGLLALAGLTYSFATDIHWLFSMDRKQQNQTRQAT